MDMDRPLAGLYVYPGVKNEKETNEKTDLT